MAERKTPNKGYQKLKSDLSPEGAFLTAADIAFFSSARAADCA